MSTRYAIYYAPDESSELAQLSSDWFSDSDYWKFTARAASYCFHGTLKAPFSLNNKSHAELVDALREFAVDQKSFEMPPLKVLTIGKFIALVPDQPCVELDTLAANCVREFDNFRAPLTEEDYQKRPNSSLTLQEVALRKKWGYPYVMDLFKFHLTLTNDIENDVKRTELFELLTDRFSAANKVTRCSNICMFGQSDRDSQFVNLERVYFGDS
jgi:hypothetical protein